MWMCVLSTQLELHAHCVHKKWFVCLFSLCLKVMYTVSTTAHVLEVSATALLGLKGGTVSRVRVYMCVRTHSACCPGWVSTFVQSVAGYCVQYTKCACGVKLHIYACMHAHTVYVHIYILPFRVEAVWL